MPTLPLYVPPASRDGWHRVTAPGGCEWWSVDADDAAQDVQVEAAFVQGFPLHPRYLRWYALYRQIPTRIRPPLPAQYPVVLLNVYERGAAVARCIAQVAPERFGAATDRLDVRAGENTLSEQPDGSLRLQARVAPWTMSWRGPRADRARIVEVDLRVHPSGASDAPEQALGAAHAWIPARLDCRMTGELRLLSPGHTAVPRNVTFDGRGGHDHVYGTRPLVDTIRRWSWVRILMADRSAAIHHVDQTDGPAQTVAVHTLARSTEVRSDPLVSNGAQARTRLGITYPTGVSCGDIRLARPRIVDESPLSVRLTYDAEWRGETGRATCTILEPHRARWPIVGRMIDQAIDRRPVLGASLTPTAT